MCGNIPRGVAFTIMVCVLITLSLSSEYVIVLSALFVVLDTNLYCMPSLSNTYATAFDAPPVPKIKALE